MSIYLKKSCIFVQSLNQLQAFEMWQSLLIRRLPSPIVRLPLRNLSISSLKSKGNDEKVVNKH